MINVYSDDGVREDFINEDFNDFAEWLYEEIKDKPEIKKLRDRYIEQYHNYFMEYIAENYEIFAEDLGIEK